MRLVFRAVVGALVLGGWGIFCNLQLGATGSIVQADNSEHPRQVKYFSLQHVAADKMADADRKLLQVRKKELTAEAQFWGYDLTAGNWTYDQTICPALPATLLIHYLQRFSDGSESLFTALIPRTEGRVRIVPVLYRNAETYIPAVKNPRNYQLFNSLVPPEIAKKDSDPEGQWLSLGVCYAEVVGGRPNVPDEPSLDPATIKAPLATYRFDASTRQRQLQFSDRGAEKVYTIWTISLSDNGRVTAAANEDYDTYVAHIVQPSSSPAIARPAAPQSVVKPAPPDPTAKATSTPPTPQQ